MMSKSMRIYPTLRSIAYIFNGVMIAVIAIDIGYYILVPLAAVIAIIGVLGFWDMKDSDQGDE